MTLASCDTALPQPIPTTMVIIMLNRLLLAIMFATSAIGAVAADNTDI